jgi:glycosyltransferase involved in cell wall biosynthesis
MHALKRWIWQKILRREAPKVDGFITVNDSIAEEHARRYPSLPPAVVVKNATIFDGEPLVPSGLLRAAADVEDDRRVLLYQGGFARHRGLEGLLRAAAQMPEPWVLVMMGWGNIEDDLKAIAHQVDPGGRRIRFIPPAPHAELKSWTSGGDLGVIPYENTCLNHWYCSPNKLWEYPVAGLPMLVSPFPELKAVVEGHGIGVCLPEESDGAALAQVLSAIDEQRLETMREACRTYIEHDNWAVYARRLTDLYTSLFNAHRQDG